MSGGKGTRAKDSLGAESKRRESKTTGLTPLSKSPDPQNGSPSEETPDGDIQHQVRSKGLAAESQPALHPMSK